MLLALLLPLLLLLLMLCESPDTDEFHLLNENSSSSPLEPHGEVERITSRFSELAVK
jgi:hypothetical protein